MTNETETPELLPCPFCGNPEVDPNGWYRMTDKVFGSGCVEFGPACDECGSIARTVAAWNTRADLADAKDKRMSDNLVEKARHNVLADMPHYASVELIEAMADRIEELEGQLKMVLDRESATHSRHDAKTDKLEALIVELEAQNRELHMQVIASDSQAQMAYEEQGQLEAKLARVIEVLERIAGRTMK